MCNGIIEELAGIDLGDKRLNSRSKKVLERLAANPEASINAAFQGWSETLGAYRFFDNAEVTAAKILEPHQRATRQRIAAEPVVLVVQDTTELDYTDHPAQDLGVLNREERRGLYDHTHAAFTPEGMCLGVLDVDLFDRTPESLGKTEERQSDPIEQKESFRWLKGYRLACDVAAEAPDTQVVNVADREGDIYDIFLEAQSSASPADFVIRAKAERSLPERDPDSGRDAYRKVWATVKQSKLLATRTVELPATPKRKARQATLEIRAKEVRVKPPHVRGSDPEVTLRAIVAKEVNPPDDGTAIEWKLLTSLPIDSLEDVLRALEYYAARWGIEIFFRVYKTGCRVEQIQLEATHRLTSCLMFYKIIAWRVMFLTYAGRECPELPCSAIFTPMEWTTTWQIVTGQNPPKQPPSLNQFLKVLASLGGYNDRKHDPDPGPQAIWIAVRRMTDFVIGRMAFQKQE